MTDTDAKKTNAESPNALRRGKMIQKNPEGESRPGRVRGGLALIFATAALVASGYLWYTVLYENADLFTRDIVGALDRIDSDNADIQDKLAGAEKEFKTLSETQDTMRAAIEKINTDLSRNRTEWSLTEAEQLLVIANNRLQLARDTHSSLAALRAADQQLQQLANPNLLPVRREIAREIAQLEPLDKTDISGITLRLATLADGVDRLPLEPDMELMQKTGAKPADKADATQVASADTGWHQTAHSLWQDLLSLVRIRNNLQAQRPLLPPEQQYFLRENLRLMLYGAQQALLQGNIPTYQQNLKSAQRLLKDFYDVRSQIVIAAQGELDKLQSTKIVAELPDISASLDMLRRISGRKSQS
ncbi:MAG TPA: uroporphyrinogen-III C-methyltransferase [Candidatus Methylomirabilis sp.]|nr:uroporphyrinogen-III C-methyltransferase [Candidatus Methylomirabilis sp.]